LRPKYRGFGLMLLPAGILFGGFALLPVLIALPLSFTDWNGLSQFNWIGPANWIRIAQDPVALRSIQLTFLITLLSWLVQTPISILIGVYLAGRQRHRAVIGAIFFLPLLLSSAAVAITWSNLLDPSFGAINQTLRAIGLVQLAGTNWLGDPTLAFASVVLVVTWTYVPFHSLLYQAGARQIPKSIYEAAQIDGASTVRMFFSFTLPLLKYTIVTSSMLLIVGAVTSFDILFMLTGGGPGSSTRILPLHMYVTGFQGYQFGYSSALAVLLAVVGSALSYVLVRASGFATMRSQLGG
jgi:raffinose/stachyose/melibiose transport system permease protein